MCTFTQKMKFLFIQFGQMLYKRQKQKQKQKR